MGTKAVIFDRDNTLVAFDQAAIAGLEARIHALAPALPAGAAIAHWLSWPGPWPAREEEEPGFWRSFWGTLATRHALPPAAGRALQSIGAFYHTCFVAFPDAPGCLGALRERGIDLALLTNFELPSVHLTLRHVGIDPAWFGALLSSSAIGLRKPDPRAYLAAADALGCAPHECLFIDDLPINVQAACAVGMRGLLLDRQRTAGDLAVERIHHLEGVADLLAV